MITGWVEGAERVTATLQAAHPRTYKAVSQQLQRDGIGLTGAVKGVVMSRLHKTGRLSRSIHTVQHVTEDRITQVVGTDVVYAEYHEYGFHGIEYVRPFTRAAPGHRKSNRRIQNKAIKLGDKKMLGTMSRVQVKAFTRKVNYAGRPYLRPTFREWRPKIMANLYKAMLQGMIAAKRSGT